jgi:hypothetical protein
MNKIRLVTTLGRDRVRDGQDDHRAAEHDRL